ncbi:unnamed protein product [marine sediment metagenome]|uniref:Uncharacterized protein n=1 Tax=marine sediment metagenome TaxID=412755 RepID=X1R819_9ZZZZ
MDPKKAREILKLAISDPDLVGAVDLMDAQKLGIQAITYVERLCAMSLEIRKGWRRFQNPIIDTHRSEHHIKSILESPPGRESGQ